MGSRTADTVKEIEVIRARLDATLRQLEGKMPPIAQMGKRALAVSGGTLGSGIALALAKRVFTRKPKAKRREETPAVMVRSGISFPAAVAIAAIWAGVKIFEAKQRAAAGGEQRASVSLLPAKKRA